MVLLIHCVVLKVVNRVNTSHQAIMFGKYRCSYINTYVKSKTFADKQYTVVQGLYKKVFGPVTKPHHDQLKDDAPIVSGRSK